MKKWLLLLLVAQSCHAGFNGPTIHSRANCLTINESISWDALNNHYYRVESDHNLYIKDRYGKLVIAKTHRLEDPQNLTWRSAAVHYGETVPSGYYKWSVNGYHFEYIPALRSEKFMGETDADDCSIYDGWWNKDHPERKS